MEGREATGKAEGVAAGDVEPWWAPWWRVGDPPRSDLASGEVVFGHTGGAEEGVGARVP